MQLIILQKEALQIMNFKDQLFYSSPLFFKNNILNFGDNTTLENIFLSIAQSVSKYFPYFVIGLHFQDICIGIKLDLNHCTKNEVFR